MRGKVTGLHGATRRQWPLQQRLSVLHVRARRSMQELHLSIKQIARSLWLLHTWSRDPLPSCATQMEPTEEITVQSEYLRNVSVPTGFEGIFACTEKIFDIFCFKKTAAPSGFNPRNSCSNSFRRTAVGGGGGMGGWRGERATSPKFTHGALIVTATKLIKSRCKINQLMPSFASLIFSLPIRSRGDALKNKTDPLEQHLVLIKRFASDREDEAVRHKRRSR